MNERRLSCLQGAMLVAAALSSGCTGQSRDDVDDGFRSSPPPPPPTLQLPVDAPWSQLAVAGGTQTKIASASAVRAVEYGSAAVVTGSGYSELSSYASLGNDAGTVDVFGKGSITLGHHASVTGSVFAASSILKGIGVNITGTEAPGYGFSALRSVGLQTVFLGGESHELDSVAGPPTLALPAGSYGSLVVETGTTVSLGGGEYFFTSLDLQEGAVLAIDAQSEEVLVHVQTALDLRGHVQIAGPSERVMFAYAGAGFAWIESPFSGSVFAPSGTIRLLADEPGGFEGSFVGDSVGVDPGTEVRQRPSAVWAKVFDRETWSPATYEDARLLPPTCESSHSCCDGAMTWLEGSGGTDVLAVVEDATCVVGDAGDDVIHGWSAGAVGIGGDGQDFISVGQGSTTYGGAGDDFIETLGHSVVFGNEGDDTIVVPGGDNVVLGGPGRDTIRLGPGDDVIVIRDACELVAGEIIDAGAGHDVVVAAVDESTLNEMARLEGVEEIVFELGGCLSECRERPLCRAGTCVQDEKQDTLSCACNGFAAGEECEEIVAPSWEPSTPPDLSDESAEPEETARAFVDWMMRARVGDEPVMRAALDAGYPNGQLREAFIELALQLVDTNTPLAAVPAIEAVAYLRCRECESALVEMIGPPVPTGEDWVYDVHGDFVGSQTEIDGLAIKRAAVNGLAFQGTRASREFLLAQVQEHPDEVVRRLIIRVLLDQYGDTIATELSGQVLPSDQDEFDRPR